MSSIPSVNPVLLRSTRLSSPAIRPKRVASRTGSSIPCKLTTPVPRTSFAFAWPWKKPWSTPSSTAIRSTAPRKSHISYRVLGDRFEVHISDEGPGFDPTDVPDPTAVENLERPCGRGLMLMRHYMTEVHYTPTATACPCAGSFATVSNLPFHTTVTSSANGGLSRGQHATNYSHSTRTG